MPKIFISIASYLDPTLKDTMWRAIRNATNPDNIVFGLGLQYYEEQDFSEFTNELRILSYHPDTRPGIVKIRREISEMMQDEDFFLQIDSHYGFSSGWDEELISYYHKISSEIGSFKAAILPLGPFPDGTIMDSRFRMDIIENIFGYNAINMAPEHTMITPDTEYDEIFFGRAGQIFLPAHFIKEVGLDPYSQVTMEIAYFSFRLLMSGYRIFRINKNILWQENNEEYERAVWNNEPNVVENRFGSPMAKDNHITWYEMALALLYNDYSKYAIKNAHMTPQKFWELQGESSKFDSMLHYYNKILYNNFE